MKIQANLESISRKYKLLTSLAIAIVLVIGLTGARSAHAFFRVVPKRNRPQGAASRAASSPLWHTQNGEAVDRPVVKTIIALFLNLVDVPAIRYMNRLLKRSLYYSLAPQQSPMR
jgi:hypothetical protein